MGRPADWKAALSGSRRRTTTSAITSAAINAHPTHHDLETRTTGADRGIEFV
jgi:hypothetical protein